MAVPKRRTSKAKSRMRRASNWKYKAPNGVECPQCGEYRLAHRACRKCGYYNTRQVIEVEK